MMRGASAARIVAADDREEGAPRIGNDPGRALLSLAPSRSARRSDPIPTPTWRTCP
jgi:hypothetical protein